MEPDIEPPLWFAVNLVLGNECEGALFFRGATVVEVAPYRSRNEN